MLGFKGVAAGALFVFALHISTTSANDSWMSHPDIVAVRQVYIQVQAGIKSGAYQELSKRDSVEACDRPEEKTLWRTASGRVVAYREVYSSDHTLVRQTRYYDNAGVVRFLFAEVSSYYDPGFEPERGTSEVQYRIYLNRDGLVIFENRRVIAPGNVSFDLTDSLREQVNSPPIVLFHTPCTQG